MEAARAVGRGILFLTPHLGCFEVSALYAATRIPITILYRPPKLKWLEPLMRAGRSRGYGRLAPTTLGGVRRLLKALHGGEAVGLLPDHVPGFGEGVWADFFGRPAYTMTLVGKLQKATGCMVILAFSRRLPKGRGFALELEMLEDDLSGPAGARRLNAAIEDLIRRCPEQYLWSYNRLQGAGRRAAARRGRGHLMFTRLAIGALWLLHFLPLGVLARVGAFAGDRVAGAREGAARSGPNQPQALLSRLGRSPARGVLKAHFRAVGRSILEATIAWWASEARLRRLVRIEGEEHARALGDRRVIFLVPHFVGIELEGLRMSMDYKGMAVYSHQKNRVFDEFLVRVRSRFPGTRMVARQEGVKTLLRGFKDGLGLQLSPDLDLGPRDAVFVPFFGVQAATVTALSRLARLTEGGRRSRRRPPVARQRRLRDAHVSGLGRLPRRERPRRTRGA